MKKNVIKVIVFLLILTLLLCVLSYIVIPKNNSEEYGMKYNEICGILGEKENSIDVIIFGDSETIASTMPMKIWENHGFTSYVCGTPGQTLTDSWKIAYEALKKQKPKMIILETDHFYSSTRITEPIAKIVNVLLPITEYHNRWKSLKSEDFFGKIDYTYTNINKGYHYVGNVLPCDDSNYMTYTDDITQIPKANKEYVHLLNKYCKYNDIEFVLMSAPSVKNWNYAKHNAVQKFAQEENIEFLDLNEKKDVLKIDWSKETGDEGDHVNYWGAIKVSNYLGKWLSDKHIFEDHKSDEYYQQWNDDLIEFNKQYQ